MSAYAHDALTARSEANTAMHEARAAAQAVAASSAGSTAGGSGGGDGGDGAVAAQLAGLRAKLATAVGELELKDRLLAQRSAAATSSSSASASGGGVAAAAAEAAALRSALAESQEEVAGLVALNEQCVDWSLRVMSQLLPCSTLCGFFKAPRFIMCLCLTSSPYLHTFLCDDFARLLKRAEQMMAKHKAQREKHRAAKAAASSSSSSAARGDASTIAHDATRGSRHARLPSPPAHAPPPHENGPFCAGGENATPFAAALAQAATPAPSSARAPSAAAVLARFTPDSGGKSGGVGRPHKKSPR